MLTTLLDSLSPAAVTDSDRTHLAEYNARVAMRIEKARTEQARAARASWMVRPDLGPIALDGDAHDATVVFLKANPNYNDSATAATHYQPHPDWPLSIANPDIAAETRDYYHGRVFGQLLKEGVTLRQIARRMLKVELFPWASHNWPTGERELLAHLAEAPSRRPICQLVDELIKRDTIFLIGKAEQEWFKAVPALRPLLDVRVFVTRAPISPSIGRGVYPGAWDQLLEGLTP